MSTFGGLPRYGRQRSKTSKDISKCGDSKIEQRQRQERCKSVHSFIPSTSSVVETEFPLSFSDLKLLKDQGITLNTAPCHADSTSQEQCVISLDKQYYIGSGSYGVVVKAAPSSKSPFPIAVKVLKPNKKLDFVSFNTIGRYQKIDINSIGNGKEKALREAVALRLLTEAQVQAVPKYVTYVETTQYKILSMQYLTNFKELSKTIDKFGPAELNSIACQTASIVCNMDSVQVYHDDMNERNILVDLSTLEVNIIDFGQAKLGATELSRHHFTSGSNFLKQPVNFLSKLKQLNGQRFSKLLDDIQSKERKELGSFCKQVKLYVSSSESVEGTYKELFDKYWKVTKKNNQFKCSSSNKG
ncbi:unnamed protein product [Didymodactylos carnosus]|uniref:non-specific serine/threonine protein kinase n=1 Tax=Didymodactylos carnosus TaxID=1234261 RepID=A0A815N8S7_9BILA|nr:unnamed protein product [Didymodactylos carnosus]CAF1433255.1 unnamed protein product [Didymodactylos carnosus]CAF3802500.1 unnamed protein product [Didymodactylos carnosus]CAF4311371.1 unnamed protein product [Didymodactylos carnosus]